MYYTKEQMEELKELDVIQHFNTTLDSEYKRGTSSLQDNKVADIYDAATGGKVSRHFGCKSCVFNLYKSAGELYRKTLEHNKKEQMRKAREAKELKKRKAAETNNNNTEKTNTEKTD